MVERDGAYSAGDCPGRDASIGEDALLQSVTITPANPIAGQPIVIVARMWQDAARSIPARFAQVVFDRLVVLRSVESGSSDIPISLQYQKDQDEYRATVIIPSAGEWKLVAFPDRSGWSSPQVPPGYPDTISLTIQSQSDGWQPSANRELPSSTSTTAAAGDSLAALICGLSLTLALLMQRYLVAERPRRWRRLRQQGHQD